MEWISVDERLPDDTNLVLIVILGCWVSAGYLSHYGDKRFYDNVLCRYENNVTHWQPMPSLPETNNDKR
ncbi:DUF551 domain-containing protein [Photorhabdus heterorhabditis]|uniref:DUF551 domain-containing protein n=1 Tax=Photorhabdus heterorhabditis TaxID=880156 RepID=UPI001BD53317|nr:DUF551 domain-containing protein [Photorhabdus heterorhabditis]MBS9442468.1 DUF551 domain-containing protein [Photorhabdus heterorhabditis]